MINKKGENEWKDLAIVLATIAGMFMVASAMFMSIAIIGVINNNQIGIEDAKFAAQYNTSIQKYGEMYSLIKYNNKIASQYGYLGVALFILSIVIALIAISLAYPKEK
ncbi:hypothetical protein J4477_01920 [Candidatus Pacearchaeota archaeon]|nr:hypothetical protein [Candidatus Pacearchaeota archaeon]